MAVLGIPHELRFMVNISTSKKHAEELPQMHWVRRVSLDCLELCGIGSGTAASSLEAEMLGKS